MPKKEKTYKIVLKNISNSFLFLGTLEICVFVKFRIVMIKKKMFAKSNVIHVFFFFSFGNAENRTAYRKPDETRVMIM